MEFRPMPKMARLSREVVVTEKIDGTNASVYVASALEVLGWDGALPWYAPAGDLAVFPGSRTRWISPEDDNFGFAAWVRDNAEDLAKLGLGHHFGEWWGKGIQRGYGLDRRYFSLFNVGRWVDVHTNPTRVECSPEYQLALSVCHVVPILYIGDFNTDRITAVLEELRLDGSRAAPRFMDPEGIVVYHTAANQLFKKTIKGDAEGKHAEAHPKKERPPRPPKDPSKGGRRVMQVEIAFPGRRKGDV